MCGEWAAWVARRCTANKAVQCERLAVSGYLYLVTAIATEVVATLNLKASEGFSRPVFGLISVIGYIGAFYCLARSLEAGVPLGVAYGVWSAIGVCAVAALSVPIFHESLSILQIIGIGLVVCGVVGIELG